MIILKTPFCKISTQNVLIIPLNHFFFKLPLGTNRLTLVNLEVVTLPHLFHFYASLSLLARATRNRVLKFTVYSVFTACFTPCWLSSSQTCVITPSTAVSCQERSTGREIGEDADCHSLPVPDDSGVPPAHSAQRTKVCGLFRRAEPS